LSTTEAGRAKRGCPVASDILGWVTFGTLAVYTLDGGRIEAVGILGAGHAAESIVADHTVGRVRWTPRTISRIARRANCVNTLLTVTITVHAAANTAAAVRGADGLFASATIVIGRIADLTCRIDTLLSVAITITATGHAPAAVGQAEGVLSLAPTMVRWITGNTAIPVQANGSITCAA